MLRLHTSLGLASALGLVGTILFGCGSDDTSGTPEPRAGSGNGGAGAGTPLPSSGGAPYASGGVNGTGASASGGLAATGGIVGTGGLVGTGGAPAGGVDGGLSTGGSSGGASDGGGGATSGTLVDPGTQAWQVVPQDEVLDVCRLDPAALASASAQFSFPWAIVRYGRLCYESAASATMVPAEAWSTTKTLGALVTGIVAYQTKGLANTGPKTGPFSDEDRADRWLDLVPYNAEAHVAHVLAMVAHNASLALGQKTMSYDTIGTVQINSLSTMLNAAIAQDTQRLGANLEQFTQRFLFGPLGMTQSTWSTGAPDKIFAYSWSTTARDMARIGLLMLHGGVWNGERILDAEWIFRMTHPAFEDGNTGYGYLTWLNASSNHHFGGIPGAPVGTQQTPQSPGPCAPVSVYGTYPHGLSASPDCNYAPPYTCDQTFDVGVWQAVGLGGQVIQGHPGLDLVLVGREITPLGTGPDAPRVLWDALRAAVVAGDPTYAGDDSAFCAAYGSNGYAPDLP